MVLGARQFVVSPAALDIGLRLCGYLIIGAEKMGASDNVHYRIFQFNNI